MAHFLSIHRLLLLLFIAPNLAFATANADCQPTAVDISTQLLHSFIDYSAVKNAADAAISAIQSAHIDSASTNSGPLTGLDSDAGARPPPVPDKALACDRIRVRKEWRQLTRQEKKAFTVAQKCLMKKPNLGLTRTTNSTTAKFWDGLTNSHAQGFSRFHAGPHFLPFHRWFVWMHGYSLEKLCQYTGPVPYWDYTLDAGPNVYKSPIFSTDPEIGFGDGGSVAINEIGGRAGGYIVDNGAFAHFRPALPVPHYLVRNFTPDVQYNADNKYGIGLSYTFNQTARARVLNATDFWDFETKIDGLDDDQFRSLHNSIHFMMGGDEQSFNWLDGTPWNGVQVFGANDPVFYLHHANVDHVWWTWQQKNAAHQFGFSGAPGANDTICDKVPFNDMGPDVPVALTLKTEWYPQCYTYAS